MLLERIGRGAARHRRWVVVVWVLALLGLGAGATLAGGHTHDSFAIPGTDSQAAFEVLEAEFPDQNLPTATVVFVAPDGKRVGDADVKSGIESAVSAVGKLDHVKSVSDPFQTAANIQKAEQALGIDHGGALGVSSDGAIATASVTYDIAAVNPTPELGPDAFDDLDNALAPARDNGASTAIGGEIADLYDTGGGGLSGHADEIGLLLAAVILVIAFGSLVAAGMPIAVALVGLGAGLAIVGILERFLTIGTVAPILGVMIGLGVGIDYSLFIVTRHRQNLASGQEPIESIGNAIATAGSAVLFAGATVCIAVLGLMIAGIPYVSTLGWVAALVVAVIVVAALTLLPALLGFAGRNIDALRILGLGRASDVESPFWGRWARTVGRRPWVFGALAIAILIALAVPSLHMRLGIPDDGTAPPGTQQRSAFDLISEHFGPGYNGPLLVTVTLPSDAAQNPSGTEANLLDVTKTLDETEGVTLAVPVPNEKLSAALVAITPDSAPDAARTKELVERLRNDAIPKAIEGTSISRADVHVGGETAVLIDLTDRIQDRLPYFIAVVVSISFLLLMVAFRSLLVPLQAAVANVLSIGAAYGAVVFVFQDGYGRALIGLPETIPVVAFVPLMMFAILFGLSMDYEVFLMSRIREEWLATGDYREAIAKGIGMTARVITSAALIMISVFLSFVTNDQPAVKMMGFGLAVAVLVDATVVRLLFVPATLQLMGRAAWWFPGWLDRLLPRLTLDARPESAEGPSASPVAAPAPPAARRRRTRQRRTRADAEEANT